MYIKSAREDPSFIEALRKLATLSGRGYKHMDDYRKKLDEVEDNLMTGG